MEFHLPQTFLLRRPKTKDNMKFEFARDAAPDAIVKEPGSRKKMGSVLPLFFSTILSRPVRLDVVINSILGVTKASVSAR